MSENETAPFMPFVPPGSTPLSPEGEPIPNKPPKPPRKAKKKKAAAPVEIKPAPPWAGSTPASAPRKRRATKAKPARKYDLQTILRVAATLKEADQAVFEKLLGELTALAKGSRERVLKALGEVFG